MEASSDLLFVPRVGWQRSRAWVQGEEREGKKEFRFIRNRETSGEKSEPALEEGTWTKFEPGDRY